MIEACIGHYEVYYLLFAVSIFIMQALLRRNRESIFMDIFNYLLGDSQNGYRRLQTIIGIIDE